jgi:hypothetical protein
VPATTYACVTLLAGEAAMREWLDTRRQGQIHAALSRELGRTKVLEAAEAVVEQMLTEKLIGVRH